MKKLLVPLAICAALGGCAYPYYPAYGGYGYGYGYPAAAAAPAPGYYGYYPSAPYVGLDFGVYGGGGWRDGGGHWHRGERDWR